MAADCKIFIIQVVSYIFDFVICKTRFGTVQKKTTDTNLITSNIPFESRPDTDAKKKILSGMSIMCQALCRQNSKVVL